MTERNIAKLNDASADLKFWWRQNRGNPTFFAGEDAYGYRKHAEDELFELHDTLDFEHKIQLSAGEKAIQLYMFGSLHGFLDVKPALDEYALQPGETIDLTTMRKVKDYPGRPTQHSVLFAGQVFYAPSLSIAETLVEGGSLQIVSRGTEETHHTHLEEVR